MVLLAAEGTAEIPTTRIAWMRTEANPAVAAAHGAALQISTIPQGRIQRQLILTNKRTGAVVLMPILAKRENFRDGYRKTVAFSVKMLIVLGISSSYFLDAKASRGRARIFHALASKITEPIRASNLPHNRNPDPRMRPAKSSSLITLKRLLGKERIQPNSSFQVVGQFIRANVGQIY